MSTDEIIREATALPAGERAQIVDALLQSMHNPDPDIAQQWLQVAVERRKDIDEGRARAVPGEEVFQKVNRRLGRE